MIRPVPVPPCDGPSREHREWDSAAPPRRSEFSSSLRARPTYHDLMDPEAGYVPERRSSLRLCRARLLGGVGARWSNSFR